MNPLILDATTKSITVVLSGAKTTNDCGVVSNWADNNGTTFTEGSTDTTTNGTTPVTIVASPASSTRRVIKSITIENCDTASVTATINYVSSGGTRILAKVTLAVGDTWTTSGTYDTNGNLKSVTTSAVGGSNTQVQYNNSGVLGGISGATSNGTTLTITSGRATTDFSPSSNDGAALGTTALGFADLFLATGGVINWANGNATLTHSTGLLTSNVPLSLGTSNAFTTGTIELGNASDTTLARVSAGVVSIEGKNIALNGTGETFTTGTIELGAASDTTLSRSSAGVLAVEGVVIPSISSTNTLTNKRITKRTGSTTSSATPTINTDNVDMYLLTAQTADITSFTTNLSGTPTEGQTLWISITGTAARAITWGASFEASTVALPTTTVTTNRLDVGFVWNTVTSKWRCVAVA